MQKTQHSIKHLIITPGRLKAQLKLVKEVASILGISLLEGYGEAIKNDCTEIYRE